MNMTVPRQNATLRRRVALTFSSVATLALRVPLHGVKKLLELVFRNLTVVVAVNDLKYLVEDI
jgi:hypothetical protein